ncbi:MAG: AAA family ATPase [Rhodoplanes sp.]
MANISGLETTDLTMPVVIALMGLPGSGKTTIAERLARARDLTVVSRDAIRAAMFRPCGYTEVEKETAYRALLLGVAACLELGRSCVVEGMPFSCASEIQDVHKLADAAGADFLPVFLDCPIDVAQARAGRDVAEQSRAPADRDEEMVARVAARFETPPPDALRVDATATPDEIAKAILARPEDVPVTLNPSLLPARPRASGDPES